MPRAAVFNSHSSTSRQPGVGGSVGVGGGGGAPQGW